MLLLSSADFFLQNYIFQKKSFKNTIRVTVYVIRVKLNVLVVE